MTIEQRVAKLEKQNRWKSRMGGLAIAAVACVVLMGQGKAKALPDLVAKSLTIKDRHGKTRASLNGATLALHNKEGRERVLLMVGTRKGEPFFGLIDTSGEIRAYLRVGDSGPQLSLSNGGGGVMLKATDQGLALLTLQDNGTGAERLRLAAGRGLSSLVLRDNANKRRIALEVGRVGVASLTLLDCAEQTRVVLGATAFKAPENTLTLLDAKGKVVWQAPPKK